MPLAYPSGTVAEHRACRYLGGGLRRQPPRHGAGHRAGRFAHLQRSFSNDLSRVHPGRAQYTHLLDEDGFVVDDIIVWWVDDERFDVMPNASNTSDVLDAIGGADVTQERAVIAVQGPEARRPPGRGGARPLPRCTGSTSSASSGAARPAWWPAPATPVRTVSSAPSRPKWRSASGRPCWPRASPRPGWAPGTPSASRRACPCTATSSAPASRRSRPGSAGSSAGTRGTSRAGPPSRRSGPTARPAGCAGWWPTGVSRCATAPSSCHGDDRVGILTSGNFSPMRERGIGLGFVDADARLLDGDPVTVRPARPGARRHPGAATPVAGRARRASSHRAVPRGSAAVGGCRIVAAQLNTPFEPERQSPRSTQSRGRRRSNSPRETLRPTYRFGEATLESGRSGDRTEGGSRPRAARLSGPMTERGGRPTSSA